MNSNNNNNSNKKILTDSSSHECEVFKLRLRWRLWSSWFAFCMNTSEDKTEAEGRQPWCCSEVNMDTVALCMTKKHAHIHTHTLCPRECLNQLTVGHPGKHNLGSLELSWEKSHVVRNRGGEKALRLSNRSVRFACEPSRNRGTTRDWATLPINLNGCSLVFCRKSHCRVDVYIHSDSGWMRGGAMICLVYF